MSNSSLPLLSRSSSHSKLKCTLPFSPIIHINFIIFILIVWSNSGTLSLKLISISPLLKLNALLRITYGIISSVSLILIAPVLGTSFVHVADVLLPPTLLITLLSNFWLYLVLRYSPSSAMLPLTYHFHLYHFSLIVIAVKL